MDTKKAHTWLSSLIAALALVAASIGLLYQDGGSSYSFTVLRRADCADQWQGVYHFDTVASASQERGQDVVTLFLGIPLLLLSLFLYLRGSLRTVCLAGR